MDRDAHARASRRREAEDALAFERDREAVLVTTLQDILAEASGEGIDAEVFAGMDDDDADLVRAALGRGAAAEVDWEHDPDDPVDSEDESDGDSDPDATETVDEDEITRLQGEIESSRRSQAALERYLELL